jgi:hypothetical protein
VAQTVTIEKGQHLAMLVEYVDEAPSKNPAWDSRWKITGNVGGPGGASISTYLGNKGLTQQVGRLGMSSPEELVGKSWIFERTAEGYLNVISKGGKVKTTPVAIEKEADKAFAAAKAFDEMMSDEPDEEAAKAAAEKFEALRAAKRKRVEEDVMWAFIQADSMVAAALANREVPYTEESMRAVVALTATLHISYKETR